MSEVIQDLNQAVSLIRAGEVVGIPTETVYGLAADANNPHAIAKIYALKSRPLTKHLALNIHPSWSISKWCQNIPKYVDKLIQNFWPGPLTLVLDLKPNTVLQALEGPHQSIALRCPDHPKTLALLETLNVPIVAPSANPSHQLSASSAEQVAAYFKQQNLKILDGGPCSLGIESTLLRAIDDKHCRILRQGAISAEQISACIGIEPSIQATLTQPEQTHFFYFEQSATLSRHLNQLPSISFCILASTNTCQQFPQALKTFDFGPQPEQNFYAYCHEAASFKPEALFIELPNPHLHPGLVAQIKKFAKPLK